MTNSERPQQPNLLVPGAQKAGTTSLYHYLGRLPDVRVPEPKEPMVFSRWERLQAEDPWAGYYDHADGDPAYVCDPSTPHLNEAYAPARIREHLGRDVSFLVLLRNPVERAVSAYWHAVNRHGEARALPEALDPDARDPEAVRREEDRSLLAAVQRGRLDLSASLDRYDDPLWQFRYVANGFYARHLDRFLDHFDRDRFRVLFTADLRERRRETVERAADFLDVAVPADLDLDDEHRQTTVPRWPAAQRALEGLSGHRLVNRLDPGLLDRLASAMRAPKPDPPEDVAAKLRAVYAEPNRRLAEEWNLELPNAWPT